MPVTVEDMSIPAADLVIVGHYDKGPGYATRRTAGSPSWLLMWTQAGGGRVEQSGARLDTRPGDLVVLGSRAAHHYRTAERRWRFWWVHFQPRPAWLTWLAPHAVAHGCYAVPGIGFERVERAFQRAAADARWTGHGAPPEPADPPQPVVATTAEARDLVLCAVEEVLLLASAAARPGGAGDPRIRRVAELIAAEPAAPYTVASLARLVALSPSRFAHLFTEQTRRTPMQAVREARVRHAARLLEVTDLDIGQVAAASGFVSPFHFSRIFSREYGMPPRDYRRAVTGPARPEPPR